MILGRSLHPSLSRGGIFCEKSNIRLSSCTAEDFPVTNNDLWLPEVDRVSIPEFTKAKKLLGRSALRELIDDCEFDDESGCWVPSGLSDDDHVEALWRVTEWEFWDGVLNVASLAVKSQLQLCDAEHCLNTRHYDFTPRLKSRNRLLEPDIIHYRTLSDGRIITSWGDDLPSVEASIKELQILQKQCPPYQPENVSPLTANGISKITIHSHTGCWLVRSYYTRTANDTEADGYGRLQFGRPFSHLRGRGGSSMAHRVVWLVTGHDLGQDEELNHKCGVRSCANPQHLEPVTHEQNLAHMMHRQKVVYGTEVDDPTFLTSASWEEVFDEF